MEGCSDSVRLSTGIAALDGLLSGWKKGTESGEQGTAGQKKGVFGSPFSVFREARESGSPFYSRRSPALSRPGAAIPPRPLAPFSSGPLRRGSTIEWLSPETGCGAMTLALFGAAEACRDGGALILFDAAGELYFPGMNGSCLSPSLLLVRAKNAREELWAWEQALRSPGAGAAVGWVERADDRSLRRLQLAAERGNTLGILLRPAGARSEPCWADARFWVEPAAASRPLAKGWTHSAGRRLRITILRARGVEPGRSIEVLWDEETSNVFVAPELADPASARQPARA